jgi:excisionase family DNA binding protein
MTLSAFAEPFGDRLPTADERAAANQLRQILAAHVASGASETLRVLDRNNQTAEIVLAPALAQLLIDLLRHVGSGEAVTLVPVSQMLTTQQAADILNVSRPYLISLIDRGEIEHHMVGRHRRIKAEHLFAYKKRRDAQRAEALADLAARDADLL